MNSFFTGKLVNYLIAFVSAVLLIFNVTNVKTAEPSINLDDYELVYADEFDGAALDHAKWRRHNDEGVRRGGYWTEDMVSVRDGNLVITTKYREDGKFGPGWYTGAISTEGIFEQAFGYYECRCILPKGQGLWSAFWLMNPDVGKVLGDATQGTEIDVFESPFYHLGKGFNNKVTSNLHYNGYGLMTRYWNIGVFNLDNNPYENYNTYGLLWTPDEYIIYINGNPVGSSHYGGVSKKPEYMILSCEVEGAEAQPTYGWSGNPEKNNKDTFSAEFLVDYVRAYKAK